MPQVLRHADTFPESQFGHRDIGHAQCVQKRGLRRGNVRHHSHWYPVHVHNTFASKYTQQINDYKTMTPPPPIRFSLFGASLCVYTGNGVVRAMHQKENPQSDIPRDRSGCFRRRSPIDQEIRPCRQVKRI